MHLIQLLLPQADNDGHPFPAAQLRDVAQELLDRFGGVTTYSRAPAEGFWDEGSEVQRDQIVVYEVMADTLDRDWWAQYRQALEQRFRQEEIVVRAWGVERL